MRSHLGGPAVRREWGEAETGLIWSMAGWFGTGSGCQGIVRGLSGDCQGIVRGLSGDRQGIVRGSIWWMGACAVISGVIVSPAGISGPAPGALIHSCSLVLVVVVVDALPICIADMHCRYAPPICIADMVNRYARPENRKGQEHVALGP